jgi:hypothetical protein
VIGSGRDPGIVTLPAEVEITKEEGGG